MDTFVERDVFEEYQKRLEDQKHRWDKRLEIIETEVKELRKLTTSVEKLALSVERMTKEQERQGERLGKIESRDDELWRKIVTYAATAGLGFLVSLLLRWAGIF